MKASAELMGTDNDFPSRELDLRNVGRALRFNGPVRTVIVDADNGWLARRSGCQTTVPSWLWVRVGRG